MTHTPVIFPFRDTPTPDTFAFGDRVIWCYTTPRSNEVRAFAAQVVAVGPKRVTIVLTGATQRIILRSVDPSLLTRIKSNGFGVTIDV